MPDFALAQPTDDAQIEATAAPGAISAPVPFWDAAGQTLQNDYDNGRLSGREDYFDAAYMQRHEDVQQRIGRDFPFAPPSGSADIPYTADVQSYIDQGGDEAQIDAFRKQYPAQMAAVPTLAQLQAQVDQQLTGQAQRAGVAAQQQPIASFAGGLAGQFLDPLNTAAGSITAGASESLPLIGRVLAQSAVWGGLAGVEAPLKAAEAQAVGGPAYGLPEAVSDIAGGLAAGPIFEGGGALLGALARPAIKGLGATFGAAAPGLTEALRADPVARGGLMAADRAIRDQTAIGPLRSGQDYEGGLDSLQTGGTSVPMPPADQDVGDLFANPRPPIAGLAGVGDQVRDGGATLYDQTAYRGRPIYAGSFEPAALATDPATFQYKADGDAAGVTDRLKGVQAWDPTSSGKVIVYQGADGGLTIADGHQRLGLANRLEGQGFEPSLDGILFRQADGWSPQDVRTIAALKNIREGQGTPLDAAKVFRASPAAMNDDSLPVSGAFIRQAKGLARLSPEAFGAAVNKVIPENQAALIGELAGARPDLHAGLVGLLHAGEPANLDEAHAMVHEAMLDDWVHQQGAQAELFGSSPAQSLAIGRAKVMASVMRSLRSDTRLFSQLVRHADAIEAGGNLLARDANEASLATNQTALEMISKLGLRHGEIGEAMQDAAGRVTGGERVGDAAKGVLARVRRALNNGERLDLGRAALLEPDAPDRGALAHAEAYAEPGGKAQDAQIAPKPEEAAIEAQPERVLFQGVRRSAVGDDRIASEYWTPDIEVAKTYAKREGAGGAIRVAKASDFPEGVDTSESVVSALKLGENGNRAEVHQIPHQMVSLEDFERAQDEAPHPALFEDIPGDEAESAALEHLRSCSP